MLDYRQTVLTALGNVENALVSYRTDQQREAGRRKSLMPCKTPLTGERQLSSGIASFIDVLDAQRQLAQAEQQRAQAQVQSALDLVALYKALGGGWEPYQQVRLPDYSVFGDARADNLLTAMTLAGSAQRIRPFIGREINILAGQI